MWTLLNQTNADIVVTDIPEEQTIAANNTASFLVRDILTSRILSQNLGNGALVVQSMASFGPADAWLPVTYVANAGTVQVTQNGNSLTYTTGVYSDGMLYVNASQLAGTLTLSWQSYDGASWYPAQQVASITTTGAQAPASIPMPGLAGRLVWALSSGGTATFRAMLFLR